MRRCGRRLRESFLGTSFLSMNEVIPEDRRQCLVEHYGVWAVETPLVAWFKSLAVVIAERAAIPDWLAELRDIWSAFDPSLGGGCVYDQSHAFVTTPGRRNLMLEVASATLQRLLDHAGDFHEAFPVTLPTCTCPDCRAPLQLSDKVGIIEIGAVYTRLVAGQGERPADCAPSTVGYLASQTMA